MAVRQIKLFADDTAEEQRRVLSADAIARKRALAEALRAQSVNAGQIESPWEGLAQMSNAVFGALGEKRAESEAERRQQALASAMGGIGTGAIDPAKLQMLMELDPELGFKIQLLERERINTEARDAAAADRADAIRREGYGREDAATEAANARADANATRRRLTPEELTTAGFAPGSVITVDRYGNYETEREAPDPVKPPEAQNTGPGDIGRNPVTGEIVYQNPAEPPPRPMTADERRQWGIPETDTRPFAIIDGEPKVIGGAAGVTVNNYPALTESQANANIYASRMENAEPLIQKFEQQGTDFFQNNVGRLPFGLGNALRTPEYQQYEQAKQDFLRAVLRKESGAVISDEEVANGDRFLFPQPFDGPEVLAQKRRARATATQAIRQATGPLQIDKLFTDAAPEPTGPGQPSAGPSIMVPPYDGPGGVDDPQAAAPPSPAPEGVSQAVWDVMTPEEKALWQN